MKKMILAIAIALCTMSAWAENAETANAETTTIAEVGKHETTATFEWKDGNVYPIYLADDGRAYILYRNEEGHVVRKWLSAHVAEYIRKCQEAQNANH